MQIEPFTDDDGYRCWLSETEQDQLTSHYHTEPKKRLAIELMLDGLRSEEVPRVATRDFRRLDADEEAYKLRVREGKTGWRECPVSNDTHTLAQTLKNASGTTKEDPLVDVSSRTVQRWVSSAAEALADSTGNTDWHHVTAHDLRRTWATTTYYGLSAPYALDVIMQWGGWTDGDTFRNNYLGKEPDDLAVSMMDEAGLR
ncbi:site-specific integrase [Halolamina sp. CBA1230]|uniref:site-specific integrase n=1 Tax=Halolamina sp. CBA1230 TaxID=1853690 RepID=UPI0009A15A46|nr:site-specific integrase [Halolamina sp. CBA1230]QKY20659.1 site-specific integrase [Halolamina sp. CBA1230]